jgi:hypothetical protein
MFNISCMKTAIAYLDYLGREPKLTTNGKSRYQTVLGGVISILTTLAIFGVGGYFVLQTFQRKQFTVIQSQSTINDPYYNFTKNPFYIELGDKQLNPIKDADRVFEIVAYLGIEANATETYPYMHMKLNSDLKYDSESLKDHTDEQKKGIYYFDMDDPANRIAIRGTWGSWLAPEANLVVLCFTKCKNSTQNKNKCLPIEEINLRLTGSKYMIHYPEYTVDHNNILSPGQYRWSSEDNEMSPLIQKKWWFTYKTISYQSDMGLVFEDWKIQTYWAYLPYVFDVQLIEEGPNAPGGVFGVMGLLGASRLDIYQRKYIKLQELLANVGGVVKGIVLIASFLVNQLSETTIWHDFYDRLYLPKDSKNKFSNRKLKQNSIIETSINNYTYTSNSVKEKTNDIQKTNFCVNILETERQKLEIPSFYHIIPLHFNTSRNVGILKELHKKILKKISIENILDKTNLVDKIKFILFSNDELSLLKHIPNSGFKNDSKKRNICRLWDTFEFEDHNHEDLKEILTKIKTSIPSEYSKKMMELI